jgi:hypothetical protein
MKEKLTVVLMFKLLEVIRGVWGKSHRSRLCDQCCRSYDS